jgi:alkylation response protein AidB-like acyl-CoA dehydrogenase
LDLRFSPEHETFRTEARAFLDDRLASKFSKIRGRGGPGDEHVLFEERWEWEQELGRHGWIGLGWPPEYGGRGATLLEQVIFYEEYARAGGPGRVGIVNEGLIGPTLVHFGDDAQKSRFLPRILDGTELWCQGYSEPNAGSDLANVNTRAVRDGDDWVISGQKVWTSLAHWSQWCFVVCRTDPESKRHKGLSYLLAPMDQPGIEIRPIVQITGTSEFNEVFFDGARAAVAHTVGGEGNGWKVAMGTLAFERGASTLGQQLGFERELATITAMARDNGLDADPTFRQRLADAWITLRVMRFHAMRTLSVLEHGDVSRETSIHKLFWANFHRGLGELAVDVQGANGMIADGPIESPEDERYPLDLMQRLFLYSRADTIYGGSNQIQRNVIGERALGLPPEPKVV